MDYFDLENKLHAAYIKSRQTEEEVAVINGRISYLKERLKEEQEKLAQTYRQPWLLSNMDRIFQEFVIKLQDEYDKTVEQVDKAYENDAPSINNRETP